MEEKSEENSKKKKEHMVEEKKEREEERNEEEKEEGEEKNKTIIVGAEDLQTLVIHSVSDLMEKGVLAESEDGKKIDLKENIDRKKRKKKDK